MVEDLYIGVDGGASHARARIRDAHGRCLGEGGAGPANVWVDLAGATRNILEACRAAAAAAGLPADGLPRLHAGLGLAGVVTEAQRELVLAQPFPFASLTVDNDAYTACLGAHGGGDGAILVVGTGSCGLAVVGGRRTNVGGWGSVVSDDGSGAALGRETLRRCLWALEGMVPQTALSREVLAAFGDEAARVAEWARNAAPADFASLAPRVFAHAEARDPLAMALVRWSVEPVALMIERLLACGAPTVCLVGGLAAPITPWLPPPLRERLAAPAADAMDGAILMARRAQPAQAPARP